MSRLASLTLPIRPRRNRQTEGIRRLVRQTEVRPSDLALPLFVIEGAGVRDPIAAMPGRHRLSIDTLIAEAGQAFAAGVPAVALFPAIADDRKDPRAGEAMNPDGLVPQAVRALKHAHPHLLVITDVAMDPYSSDGHDGLVIAETHRQRSDAADPGRHGALPGGSGRRSGGAVRHDGRADRLYP